MENSKTITQEIVVSLLEAELEYLEHCIEQGFSIEDWLEVRSTELKGAKLACVNIIESEQESLDGNYLNEDDGQGISFSKLPF